MTANGRKSYELEMRRNYYVNHVKRLQELRSTNYPMRKILIKER